MADPARQVVLGEEEAQQAAERYAKMEAELQALRQQNEELARTVQEQQEMVAKERVRADCRARAQRQEFTNLTAELLAGRQGPDVQFQGMRNALLGNDLKHTMMQRTASDSATGLRRICKRSEQPKIGRLENNDARLILRKKLST